MKVATTTRATVGWLAGVLACALATACPQPDQEPACPAGEVQDEQTGQCVPEHCGTGPWGALERTGQTVHVAPWGDDDWDGSEQWPYRTIQEGADEAEHMVAVAAGTDEENLELDEDHDGVEIAGRCAELVTIDGGGDEEPGVEISSGEILLRQVRVTGGQVGVLARSAIGSDTILIARDLHLDENTEAGLVATGSGAEVDFEGGLVSSTEPDPSGSGGRGLVAQEGASLLGRGLVLDGNHEVGVVVFDTGTLVELVDTTIRDTQPRPDGSFGQGIGVQGGARLVAIGCLLEGNHRVGLQASSGATVELERTTVLDTRLSPDGADGQGVVALSGATVTATGLLLEGNHSSGLLLLGVGTRADIEDSTVRGTLEDADGTEGVGVNVEDGSTLVGRGLLLEMNHAVGLFGRDAGTTIDLEDSTIRDTQPTSSGTFGRGIQLQEGPLLSGRRLVLEGNSSIGLLVASAGTTVELQDVTVRGTQAEPGTAVGGRGVSVHHGATLLASGLHLEGNNEAGIVAHDDGTSLDLDDVTILGTEVGLSGADGIGLIVQKEASATVHGLAVQDSEGPGILVSGRGSLDARDVSLLRCGFAGAVASGGDLALTDAEISGSVSGVTEGGGVGIFAWFVDLRAEVSLQSVTFSELAGPALYARGPGRYVVRDCRVADADVSAGLPGGIVALEGVERWHELGDSDLFTGLLVEGTSFTDLPGDAILLDSSSATLDFSEATGASNSFDALGGEPLVWQRCDGASAPEVLDGAVPVPSCEPVPRTLGPPLEYHIRLSETEVVE